MHGVGVNMKIIFLGTGTSQGVPVIACKCDVCKSKNPKDKRLRTSALVVCDTGEQILIDIGPDFREQMLRHQVEHLDAILITHAHRDHVGGIDDIRSFNYVQQEKMQLYGNHQALTALQRDYHYIFEPHIYPGLPEADLHVVDANSTIIVGQQSVVPIAAFHKDLPVLGYRIGDLVYLTDCNHIYPDELLKLTGCKILVIGSLRKEKHFSHFCLQEAIEVIRKVAPEQAFLIHMSHQMGLHDEVEKELPPNVNLAYDNLEFDF